MVAATAAGVTSARVGNVVTFTVPIGVRIMSATIRMPGANLVGGGMQVDGGRTPSGWKDRWTANTQAWREDSGAMLAITVTHTLGVYNKFNINGLNATTTNYIKLAF
jgi:hypothetical protein